jgi:hypothetical protein
MGKGDRRDPPVCARGRGRHDPDHRDHPELVRPKAKTPAAPRSPSAMWSRSCSRGALVLLLAGGKNYSSSSGPRQTASNIKLVLGLLLSGVARVARTTEGARGGEDAEGMSTIDSKEAGKGEERSDRCPDSRSPASRFHPAHSNPHCASDCGCRARQPTPAPRHRHRRWRTCRPTAPARSGKHELVPGLRQMRESRILRHAAVERSSAARRSAQPLVLSFHSCSSCSGSRPAGLRSSARWACSHARDTSCSSTHRAQATSPRLAPPKTSKPPTTSNTCSTEISIKASVCEDNACTSVDDGHHLAEERRFPAHKLFRRGSGDLRRQAFGLATRRDYTPRAAAPKPDTADSTGATRAAAN